MEQTVNQFNKGLQMDTHPMVQSPDSLSDALNATFVTMNGNEVILQNDMGNRRVDNAFLPPGYEPVGIKEYGGIIYIASYNPITNKSQIGSFPSPQKKIDSLDDGNLKGIFNFTQFTSPNNIEKDEYLGVNVLKNDTFMVPLSSDTSLRAGDKFAIYAQDLHAMEQYLTNYNNTCYVWKEFNDTVVLNTDYETYFQNDDYHKIENDKYYFARWKECEESEYNQTSVNSRKVEDNKYYIKEWTEISSNIEGRAYSPKNRMYTLQVGVLNSQNEFVDITKTLCRWELQNNTWVPKTYESEESEIFKFNDGYFISDTFNDQLRRNSLKDSQLIKKRQQMAANTYSYKLVGPLYLKATYNHVESFNYNIYGTYNNNQAILYVEGYLTYNCPDNANIDNIPQNINEDFGIFDEGEWDIQKYPGFDLIDNEGNVLVSSDTSISKSIYNPNTNLYSNKIVKKYIINVLNQNPIFNYTLGVYAGDSTFGNVFIKGLSTKGSLDLSLLGSGQARLTGWRFYNNYNKQSTTLTFSFNAYPEYGKHFGDLVFNFKDITRENEIGYEGINYPKEYILPLYNGQQTYVINWGSYLEPQKVYKVTATYKILNDSDNSISANKTLVDTDLDSSNRQIERWLLTTELFNEFYSTSKGILDFCDLSKALPNSDQGAFNDKMRVLIEGKESVNNMSKENDRVYSGGMASSQANINYSCESSYSVNITSNPKFEIKNKQLYPDFITINPTHETDLVIDSYKVERIGSKYLGISDNPNSILKTLIDKVKGTDDSGGIETAYNNENVLDIDITNSNNKLTGTIKYYDIYKGYSQNGITNAQNVFGLVSDLIKIAGPANNNYGCVLTNYDSRSGHRDEHMIDAYHKQGPSGVTDSVTAGLRFTGAPDDQEIFDGGYRVYSDNSDSTQCISFKQVASAVFGHWNSGLYNGQMFIFMFPSGAVWYSNNQGWDMSINGNNKARVWWRTSEGEWAQFRTLINAGQTFENYITRQFSYNYIYCMYDSFSEELSQIHATNSNYIYNDKYNIPLVLNITYKIKDGTQESNLLNGTSIEIGNLQFSQRVSTIGSSSITFDLNSSDKFQDTIKSFDVDSINNVDSYTGLDIDSKGRKLNPNYLYIVQDLSGGKKQLIRVDNSYISVDFENKLSGKNTLTYNKHNTIGTPEYRYDHSGDDDDDHTLLDYNSINVVSGI